MADAPRCMYGVGWIYFRQNFGDGDLVYPSLIVLCSKKVCERNELLAAAVRERKGNGAHSFYW